ncbi:cytochrome P450 3A29-like [Macrobrachium nipponense]|uniref:cytochrome P450 3A29-like n=1 Tax=Macrobrachium nipponense TaxID=159736 RepID=UPI0030C863A6
MDGLFGWLFLDLSASTWATLFLVATVIGIAIIERWWHMGKLERLGYTGPPKNFLFGNLKEIAALNTNFQDGWKEIIDKYGSQVGNLEGKSMALYTGRVPCIIVTNPEVIKYVGIRAFEKFRNRSFRLILNKDLLSLRDDHWRSVRSTLSPSFSQAKMKLVRRTVDALQLMLEAAQLVSSEEAEKKSPKTNSSVNLSNGKEEGGGKRLQNGRKLDKREPKMTEEELAENAIFFLLAGYETISTMLSYTTYLLAKHPDVQQRLYEEIVQHLSKEEVVTYDTINQLEYLDMVVKESLRMYPPIVT